MPAAGPSPLFEVHQPIRSVSLPTTLSSNLSIEDELSKLRTFEASSRSLCTDDIQFRLVSLADLYVSMEGLLGSPSTLHQAALVCPSRQAGKLLVEEAIDMSVPLLDTCSAIKDLLLQLKQQVQDLQSALRRRRGGSSVRTSAEEDVVTYLNFRKKAKKDIAKCLRSLKQTESKYACHHDAPLLSVADQDNNSTVLLAVKLLRQLYGITISIFRSLLISLSMPGLKTKPSSGWAPLIVSKLVRSSSSADSTRCHRNIIGNEVGHVDIGLHSLLDAKTDVQHIQGMLRKLEAGIQCMESALERLFRHQVRSRVSLLNILTC